VLFTTTATNAQEGVWIASGLVDVSEFAGKSVELCFGLNSGGLEGGTMSVRGIEFYTAPPPTLSIVSTGEQFTLTWPLLASGYQLQTTTDLSSSGSWQNVTQDAAQIGYEFVITNGIAAPASYYRLIRRIE
jgi:hypothetical protein